MRRLFTTEEARARGLTMAALIWGERVRRWRRVTRGVYAEGPGNPDAIDRSRAAVIAAGCVASGSLAAVLHGLDGVTAGDRSVRRRSLPASQVAAEVDDEVWEQALESALRTRLTSIAELEGALPGLGRARTPGTARMRRVLALRPPGAPATESLLETLMVQLARDVPGLPPPTRQFEVYDADGIFVARVDLTWPDLGLFVELDGQQHKDQPVYDARRETAVVAATAWLPGRFTWREVVHLRRTTTRRLGALAEQARRRPLGDGFRT